MGRTSEERVLTKWKEHFEERMNKVKERKREAERWRIVSEEESSEN